MQDHNKTMDQAIIEFDADEEELSIENITNNPLLERKSGSIDIPPSTESTLSSQQAFLEIEGGQDVFYRGTYVTRIPLKGGDLIIGRRDVVAGYYPDIDLMMYRKLDPAISRRHCSVFRDIHGKYFVEDLCNNNATFLNTYDNKLNLERRELKHGDRIFISMSISIVFKTMT